MITIIDYGAGNTGSVQNALHRLGTEGIITADADIIRRSDKIILPGVGEAAAAMERLRNSGLSVLLPTLRQPVLGICLGLQLMCRYSEEGHTHCLNIINTNVRRFPEGYIVPHMGWNNLDECDGVLFQDIKTKETDMYFVHSYYAEVCAQTTSICHYIVPFSATLQYGNFYATQFHPEKSGDAGAQLLANFLTL